MTPELLSLISGFVGTVLGAAVSIVTVWLQQRHQSRQERARLAVDAAVKEYESAESYAQFMAKQGQRIVTFDLGYYIALHSRLIERLGESGSITSEEWVAAHKQAMQLSDAAVEFHRQRNAQQRAQADGPASGGPAA